MPLGTALSEQGRLLITSQAASVTTFLPFFSGFQRPVADVHITPVRDSGVPGVLNCLLVTSSSH